MPGQRLSQFSGYVLMVQFYRVFVAGNDAGSLLRSGSVWCVGSRRQRLLQFSGYVFKFLFYRSFVAGGDAGSTLRSGTVWCGDCRR